MSSERIVVNIPPMPRPEEYGFEPRDYLDDANRKAKEAYEQALKAWVEVTKGLGK